MTTRARKRPVRGTVRVNTYERAARAVEEGIAAGYRLAHKHLDDPGESALCSTIHSEVMESLAECFLFDREDAK